MKHFVIFLALCLLGACNQKKEGGAAATPSSASETKAETEVKELLIYNGRKEEFTKPFFDMFEKKTGIKIVVKSGKSSGLANTLLVEKENSPADIFFSQDASNLGAVSTAGLFEKLPTTILNEVDGRYRSVNSDWVGTSGRARVLVYNKEMVKAEDLPKTMQDLTDAKWKGKLAWAPKNGSFQSHIAAMIKVLGIESTTKWLKAMKANGIEDQPKNSAIVRAVAEKKVSAGLVNHYYLYKIRKDMPEAKNAENHFFENGDMGMFINVSGMGILKSSKKKEAAQKFIDFMLSKEAQEIFRDVNYEYPMAAGVNPHEGLKSLAEINPVKCDLGDLEKIEETQKVLEAAGCL